MLILRLRFIQYSNEFRMRVIKQNFIKRNMGVLARFSDESCSIDILSAACPAFSGSHPDYYVYLHGLNSTHDFRDVIVPNTQNLMIILSTLSKINNITIPIKDQTTVHWKRWQRGREIFMDMILGKQENKIRTDISFSTIFCPED